MSRFLVLFLTSIFLFGCASRPTRNGVISQELPLTLDDLAEIRNGEQNNERVLWEYRAYQSPKLQSYANAIAASIAAVSTRPNLPYKVVLLDTDEVNIFGGAGGYIYVTRGLFNFIDSESELAGVIAHEIAHVASYEYSGIPQYSRVKTAYGYLMRGSELAKDSIGTYGTATNYVMKGIGKAAPIMVKRFTNDQEIQADKNAVKYLVDAGYDPRGFEVFQDRLSKIEMQDVNRFVLFMNTHPPFQDRRTLLHQEIAGYGLDRGKIDFRQDMLSEVRQVSVNNPYSILYEPQFGRQISPAMEAMDQDKGDKIGSPKKRWAWF